MKTRACRIAAAVVALGGCQRVTTESPGVAPAVVVTDSRSAPETERPAIDLEKAVGSDPCAIRLTEISGALLQYYALQGRLPAKLADLKVFADADRPLHTDNPSGVPFAYAPAGLRSETDARSVIVYDDAPKGKARWAILMQKPRGRQPASMWVLPLSQEQFAAYAPVPSATTAPAPR